MQIAHRTYVGWDPNVPNFNVLFTDEHLTQLQDNITKQLKGVTTRPIVVPIDTIRHVLWQCIQNHRPNAGGIGSLQIDTGRDDLGNIVRAAERIITSTIRTEYQTVVQNRQLNIWNTILGDFNALGIRSHPEIKVRLRKPETMQFNMRY